METLWDPDDQQHASIMAALEPIIRGIGDIGESPVKKISPLIHLIPGDLALSGFESNLSEAWGKCLDSQEPARKPIFNLTAAYGAIGSHAKSVQDCGDDFKRLAKRILDKFPF